MRQTVNAIYEDGVLKPLEPVKIKEHSRVCITLETEEERDKKIAEILRLARKSYEGLSEEELSVLEDARLRL